jgi:putative phosphoesterase
MTMRIAAISDIHVRSDGSDKALVDGIRVRVEELSPDVFIIAGDISDRLQILSQTLAKLHLPKCVNLYVAGNHDLWLEDDKPFSSLEKYSHVIGETCRENGFIHLPDNPYIIDDVAFVGSVGWYDYSLRSHDLRIPDSAYEQKEFRGEVWFDAFSIEWDFSDREATELFNRRLEYDLSNLPGETERVVYVSHHIPFRELSFYKGRLPWDFFSAFMGAESTGKVLRKDSRVRLSISGHSHVRKKTQIGPITALTVPLGYGRPSDDGIADLVRAAVAQIDISGEALDVPGFVEGDICADLPYGDHP